jgi:hypothetical protein
LDVAKEVIFDLLTNFNIFEALKISMSNIDKLLQKITNERSSLLFFRFRRSLEALFPTVEDWGIGLHLRTSCASDFAVEVSGFNLNGKLKGFDGRYETDFIIFK